MRDLSPKTDVFVKEDDKSIGSLSGPFRAKTKTEWMVVAAATRRRGRRRIYGRVLPQMVKRRVNRRTLGDSFERERTLDVIVYELSDLTGVE
jgi:hypothetical protein